MDVSSNPVRRPLPDDVSDVTLVNWPQVDYWLTPLLGVDEVARGGLAREGAGIVGVLPVLAQNDAPRPGGTGIPSCGCAPTFSAPQMVWRRRRTFEKVRRIAAEFTVLETHVGVEARPGADRAEPFTDTVGLATGSTCTRVPRVGGTSTSRPTRSRFRWAPCCRSGSTTRWRPASAWRHPHHQRLLPAAPDGMERRRGRWRFGRILPGPSNAPTGCPRPSQAAR